MAKPVSLSEVEYKVLSEACQSHGCAAYLFTKQVAKLAKLGMIEPRNEHSYKATEAGRARWLAGPRA